MIFLPYENGKWMRVLHYLQKMQWNVTIKSTQKSSTSTFMHLLSTKPYRTQLLTIQPVQWFVIQEHTISSKSPPSHPPQPPYSRRIFARKYWKLMMSPHKSWSPNKGLKFPQELRLDNQSFHASVYGIRGEYREILQGIQATDPSSHFITTVYKLYPQKPERAGTGEMMLVEQPTRNWCSLHSDPVL